MKAAMPFHYGQAIDKTGKIERGVKLVRVFITAEVFCLLQQCATIY